MLYQWSALDPIEYPPQLRTAGYPATIPIPPSTIRTWRPSIYKQWPALDPTEYPPQLRTAGYVTVRPPPIINYAALSAETDLKSIRTVMRAGTGTVLAVVTESFTADGLTIYWPLQFTPDTSAIPPTMTAGGVSRSISSSGPGSASTAYGLLTLANGRVALSAGSDGVPPSGTVLTVTYAYDAPVLVQLQNASAVALAAALPNWGKLGYQTQSAGATYAEAAADVQGQLGSWAAAITRVRVTATQESNLVGLEEGQTILFTSNRLGIVGLQMAVSQETFQGAQGGTQGRTLAPLVLEA